MGLDEQADLYDQIMFFVKYEYYRETLSQEDLDIIQEYGDDIQMRFLYNYCGKRGFTEGEVDLAVSELADDGFLETVTSNGIKYILSTEKEYALDYPPKFDNPRHESKRVVMPRLRSFINSMAVNPKLYQHFKFLDDDGIIYYLAGIQLVPLIKEDVGFTRHEITVDSLEDMITSGDLAIICPLCMYKESKSYTAYDNPICIECTLTLLNLPLFSSHKDLETILDLLFRKTVFNHSSIPDYPGKINDVMYLSEQLLEIKRYGGTT